MLCGPLLYTFVCCSKSFNFVGLEYSKNNTFHSKTSFVDFLRQKIHCFSIVPIFLLLDSVSITFRMKNYNVSLGDRLYIYVFIYRSSLTIFLLSPHICNTNIVEYSILVVGISNHIAVRLDSILVTVLSNFYHWTSVGTFCTTRDIWLPVSLQLGCYLRFQVIAWKRQQQLQINSISLLTLQLE